MTTPQLDHLKRIDAHLANLLDIATRRTPGEWLIHGMSVMSENGARIASTEYTNANGRPRTKDVTFLAFCAGNAEAGWKATRAAIAGLLRVYDRRDEPTSFYAEETLTDILAAFPLELIEA